MWNNPISGAILPHPSLGSKSKIFVQEENKLLDAFKELLNIRGHWERTFSDNFIFFKTRKWENICIQQERSIRAFWFGFPELQLWDWLYLHTLCVLVQEPPELRAEPQFLPALEFRNISIKFGSITCLALTGQRWIKLRSQRHCLIPGTYGAAQEGVKSPLKAAGLVYHIKNKLN